MFMFTDFQQQDLDRLHSVKYGNIFVNETPSQMKQVAVYVAVLEE